MPMSLSSETVFTFLSYFVLGNANSLIRLIGPLLSYSLGLHAAYLSDPYPMGLIFITSLVHSRFLSLTFLYHTYKASWSLLLHGPNLLDDFESYDGLRIIVHCVLVSHCFYYFLSVQEFILIKPT